VRGVVALGPAPAVELFSQGLRVRSATALSDLLESGRRSTSQTRVRFSELVEGVAPQALLEGGRLDLTMARSDAHETRALARLVHVANRELSLLIEKQLDRVEGRRAWRSVVLPTIAALLIAGLLGYAARAFKGSALDKPADRSLSTAGTQDPPSSSPRAYRDLARAYAGPAAAIASAREPSTPGPLRYSPTDRDFYIAGLRVAKIDAGGRAVVAERPPRTLPPYTCTTGCVDIELLVADGPGPLRVPLPTGHALEPESLQLDTEPLAAMLGPLDQPILDLDRATTGTLRYRTGPASVPNSPAASYATAAPRRLPAALVAAARSLHTLETKRRVEAAIAWVAEAVRYSDEPPLAPSPNGSFVAHALQRGAGDCDVQNTVLMALLRELELEAHLAVGYVGRGGVTLDSLHAWVEYRDPNGRWAVADASLQTPPHTPALSPGPGLAADPNAPLARSTSAPTREQRASRLWSDGRLWPRGELWMLGAVGALLALSWWALRTRVERALELPDQPDLTALLSGALQRPDAFIETPSVFQRPLLRLADGKRLSLAEAWRLSHRGQLYVSSRPSSLLDEARGCGARVLDATRPESRSVAGMLGAISLDVWQERLHAAHKTGLLRAVAEHFARYGERWTLRALPVSVSDEAASRGDSSEVLEIIGRSGHRASGYALVDGGTRAVADAEALRAVSPALALFMAGEEVAELLGIPAQRRADLLAPLAREALLERA